MYKPMTSTTDPYIDIRPYNDDEIPAALSRLINDQEFISAILKHRFKHHSAWLRALMAPLVKFYLKRKWAKLDSVEAIQLEVKKIPRPNLRADHERGELQWLG